MPIMFAILVTHAANDEISINTYLHVNVESVGKGQYFGIGSVQVCVYSPFVL